MTFEVNQRDLKESLQVVCSALSKEEGSMGSFVLAAIKDGIMTLSGDSRSGSVSFAQVKVSSEEDHLFSFSGSNLLGFLKTLSDGFVKVTLDSHSTKWEPSDYTSVLVTLCVDSALLQDIYKKVPWDRQSECIQATYVKEAVEFTSPFALERAARSKNTSLVSQVLCRSGIDSSMLSTNGQVLAIYRHPDLSNALKFRQSSSSMIKEFLSLADTFRIVNTPQYTYLVSSEGTCGVGYANVIYDTAIKPLEGSFTVSSKAMSLNVMELKRAISRMKWGSDKKSQKMGFSVSDNKMTLVAHQTGSTETIDVTSNGSSITLFYLNYQHLLKAVSSFGDKVVTFETGQTGITPYVKLISIERDVTKVLYLSLSRKP